MKRILITGICGFAGSRIALRLTERIEGLTVVGFDNLSRPGSELNRRELTQRGARVFHADLRSASDFETLPEVDWVIDAAANPSVLAGIDGQSSSRQLVEHNCVGTVNLLEYCRSRQAGLILLSTSRVYSIPPLAGLALRVQDAAFCPLPEQEFPAGLSPAGISETYSTQAPVSLYGATKLASESLALEYGHAFDLPVWVNRCGVLSAWCTERIGKHPVGSEPSERPYDLPWVVLDSLFAQSHWGWTPKFSAENIFEEIATHADAHPDWMALSAAY